jgi:hypothetical protein
MERKGGSDFISNPWYEAWAEEAGLLHDPMSKQPVERTTMDVETPNMKYAYMATGAITFAGVHYAILAASDGPLPIMDYVALATAPKVARMGATAGGIVYDLTH